MEVKWVGKLMEECQRENDPLNDGKGQNGSPLIESPGDCFVIGRYTSLPLCIGFCGRRILNFQLNSVHLHNYCNSYVISEFVRLISIIQFYKE